jgi:hypothetical protein
MYIIVFKQQEKLGLGILTILNIIFKILNLTIIIIYSNLFIN